MEMCREIGLSAVKKLRAIEQAKAVSSFRYLSTFLSLNERYAVCFHYFGWLLLVNKVIT